LPDVRIAGDCKRIDVKHSHDDLLVRFRGYLASSI